MDPTERTPYMHQWEIKDANQLPLPGKSFTTKIKSEKLLMFAASLLVCSSDYCFSSQQQCFTTKITLIALNILQTTKEQFVFLRLKIKAADILSFTSMTLRTLLRGSFIFTQILCLRLSLNRSFCELLQQLYNLLLQQLSNFIKTWSYMRSHR